MTEQNRKSDISGGVMENKHIDAVPGRCGGRACVAGTRVRVWDVHVWHDLRGWSPSEIVTQFPQLSLADVHAALAYYHDHRDEIDGQMQEAREFIEAMKSATELSPLQRVRDQDRADAEVSPG